MLNIENIFKLFDMFNDILDKPVVKTEKKRYKK